MAKAIALDESDPDIQLSRKFNAAWLADLDLIRQITLQESQEEEDRIFAARLAGVSVDTIPDDVRGMAMLLYDSNNESDNDEVQSTPISNSPVVSHKVAPVKQHRRKKCTLCMEYTIKTDPCLPCKHIYCIDCLQELFTKSMQDETLMPPRCCQQIIPVNLARLTLNEIENFNAKQLEYSTKDRLYCSRPTCSAFIPPAHITNSIGTCPKPGCGITTCSICKAASHGTLDCPKDEETSGVLAIADQAGWSRCYQCRALVELTQGCFHMTCRCHAQFCYLCKKPWKNCPCPQWDESRLVTEARIRSARIPAHQMRQTNNRGQADEHVQRMVDRLRANYECRHTNQWEYRAGGGRCDECSDYLRQYLFRCSQCHLMACNRCRRNRL
ncbi:unnamed protein product [Rotaria socialis]|uniref:RBR-type E3 ubiquitin transferase n=1 Tax=Rotaria socialis TaxID=392032 RepID=A0A818FHJ2_9BILA|nr:unnamed protein product [Rotaria socialis]CAF3464375.1 unnamed protein product [Rotaria socialis]CAF3476124.1 unnamed protein product [Rotaria socialis]CAF3587153.1 unnamed protein product [Rotaria socialis]